MRVLIFDTETSGFPEKGGKLVQFAAHICDLSFIDTLTVQEFSTLVKCPDPVPDEVLAIHGISQEMSQTGIDPKQVCQWFLGAAARADLIVAHNSAFDMKVMEYEFERAQIAERANTPVFCTMKASTDLCRLPGKYGFKWPKLAEAMDILCGVKLENAHDALADTRGCRVLLLELVKRGLVPAIEEIKKRKIEQSTTP